MSVPTYFYSHPRCSFFPPSGGIREIIALIYGDDKPLPYRIKGVKSWLKMYNLRLPLNPIEELYIKKILRDNNNRTTFYNEPISLKMAKKQRLLKSLMKEKSNIPITLNGIINNELIFVKGGEFILGDGRNSDNPATPVKVSDFYISKYQITQDLYQRIMGENPSRFKGARHPVEQVSWVDAVKFCNELSMGMGLSKVYDIPSRNIFKRGKEIKISDIDFTKILDLTKSGFCLPSEATWEYAAREAPSNSPFGGWGAWLYSGADDLEEVGWYWKNSCQESKPVGLKQPNALGLYDMSGNVWEWCEDDWDSTYYQSLKNKPHNPINIARRGAENSDRVVRGGSWDYLTVYCRVSTRDYSPFDECYDSVGFRVCIRVI